MEIKLDFRIREPIYIQIVEQIRRQIASGVLKPGDQLPTVRQMAVDLGVNFNTVARAYRQLDEAGVISTQHGRGTYILAETSQEKTDQLRRQALEELTRHYLRDAVRLEFRPEEVKKLFDQCIAEWESGDPTFDKDPETEP